MRATILAAGLAGLAGLATGARSLGPLALLASRGLLAGGAVGMAGWIGSSRTSGLLALAARSRGERVARPGRCATCNSTSP